MEKKSVASIRIKELQKFSEDAYFIQQNIASYQQLQIKNKQSAVNSGPAMKLKKQGFNIKESLYYMLHPKYISDIMKRTTDSQAVMKNAVQMATSRSMGTTVPIPSQQYKTYSSMLKFREAISKGTPSDISVTAFDLETIGGKDQYGINKIRGIYDYAFINIDAQLQKKRYSGLIGVNNDAAEEVLKSISNALKNNDVLTHEQELTYEYISRLGASFSEGGIVKKGSNWITENLTEKSKLEFMTPENFESGYKLLRNIGSEQGYHILPSGAQLPGGYKNLLDTMIESTNTNSILMGHNISRFDIPVLRHVLDNVPGAQEYLDSQNFDFNDVFNINKAYDTREIARHFTASDQEKLIISKLYPNGVEAVAPGMNPLQLESIYTAMAPSGSKIKTHHSGLIDTEQDLRIAGIDYYDGTDAFTEKQNIYSSLENMIVQNVNGVPEIESQNINEELGRVFEGNGKIYVQPLKNGGAFSNASSNNFFGYIQQDNNITFSDGSTFTVNENGEIIKAADSAYTPGIFRKGMTYEIDPSSISQIQDESIIRKFGEDRFQFSGNKSIVGFKMKPLVDDADKVFNRSSYETTIFMPESEFGRIFSEHFNVVKVGDKITAAGKNIAKNTYRLNQEGILEILDKSDPVDITKNSASRIILENTARRIEEDGSYDTIMKGISIRNMADKGGVALEEMSYALRELSQGKNPKRFMEIISGENFTSSLESEAFYGFNKKSPLLPTTWINAWDINRSYNPSWFDNSIAAARAIDPESIGAKIIRKVNNSDLPYFTKKRIIQESLDKVMSETDWPQLPGKTAQWHGYVDSIAKDGTNSFSAYVPGFIRSTGIDRVKSSGNGYIDLNLSDPYKNLNKLKASAVGLDKALLNTPQGEKALVYKFIKNFIKENEQELFTVDNKALQASADAFKQQIQNIAEDQKLTSIEQLSKFNTVLSDMRQVFKENDHYIGYQSTVVKNILTSPIFTQPSLNSDKRADRVVSYVTDIIENAEARPKNAEEALEVLKKYIGGGIETENAYKEQIQYFNKESQAKRMAIFRQQRTSHEVYAEKLLSHLERNKGSFRIDKGGHLYISFAENSGIEMDVTGMVPRLESNNGASYSRIGNSAYSTGMVASITPSGKMEVRPNLESHLYKMDNLQDKIDQLRSSKRQPLVTAFAHSLKSITKELREKENLSSVPARDIIANTLVDINTYLTDPYSKKNLQQYLDNVASKYKDIPEFENIRKFLRNTEFKDPDFIKNTVKSDFFALIDKGIIPASFTLPDIDGNTLTYNLNVDLKNSKVEAGKLSAVETYFGASALNNPALGSRFVEEATLNLNVENLNTQSQAIIGTNLTERTLIAEDGTKTTVPIRRVRTNAAHITDIIGSTQVTNKIAVKRLEASTKNSVEIIKTLEQMGADLKVLNKLGLKIQTFEGGGYISGQLIRSLGIIPGTQTVPITMREIKDQNQVKALATSVVQDENGRYKFQYGKGYVVKQGDKIVSNYSFFGDTEENLTANRASTVEKKFYEKVGDVSLTAEQASKKVYEYAQKNGITISTPEDFERIGKAVLYEKISAAPIDYNGMVKAMTGAREKHMLQVGLTSLKEIDDAEIQKILKNPVFSKASKALGVTDITDLYLAENIFQDIASNKFQHPIFDAASKSQKVALRSAISEYGEETWSKVLIDNRQILDDYVALATGGAQVISRDLGDAYKHKNLGFELERTYDLLADSFVQKKYGHIEAAEKALEIISPAFVSDDGKLVKLGIDNNGNLIVPESSNWGVNFEKLDQIRSQHGIKLFAEDGLYEDTISFISDPVNFNKTPKMGGREENALTNLMYSQESLDRVRKGMGDDKKFVGIFGSALDKDYQLKKEYNNISVWNQALKAMSQSTSAFKNGDTLYEKARENIPEHLKDGMDRAYSSIRKALGPDTKISKEFVENYYWAQSAQAASELEKLSRDAGSADKRFQRYAFKDISALDAEFDFLNNAEYSQVAENSVWKQNTRVDLIDESLGLTEDFFGKYNLNGYLYMPQSGYQSVGSSLILRDHQQKAASILRDYTDLRALSEERDPDKIRVNQKEIERIKNNLPKKIVEYEKELADYVKNPKEGGAFNEATQIRPWGGNRAKVNVYDVKQLMEGDATQEVANFSYYGQKFKDIFASKAQGGLDAPIGFVIASTKDLAAFGYNDQYFKDIGVNKEEWIKNASTKGVRALVGRQPNDYYGSVRGIQLYFSENLGTNTFLADSVSAALMKADSDGDTMALYTLNVMNESKGRYVDLLGIDMAGEEKLGLSKSEAMAAHTLRTVHRQSMEMDRYTTFKAGTISQKGMSSNEEYLGRESYNEYNKAIEAKRAKILAEQGIDNVIWGHNSAFMDQAQKRELEKQWAKASNILSEAISKYGDAETIKSWENATNYGKFAIANNILAGEAERYKLGQEQLPIISKGMRARQKMIDPYINALVQKQRGATGEIDTPLDVIDSFAKSFRTGANSSLAPDRQMTADDNIFLNYGRESLKEGFETPKKASDAVLDESYIRFTDTFNKNLDTLIKGSEGAAAAEKELFELMSQHGRDVTERNLMPGGVMKTHSEMVRGTLDSWKKLFNNLTPEVREKGVFGLRELFMISNAENLIQAASIDTTSQYQRINAINAVEAGFEELRESIIKTQQSSMDSMMEHKNNVAAVNAVKNAKRNDGLQTIKFAENILPKNTSKGWGKIMVGFAAGVLFAGYAGGNPATPAGSEARNVQPNNNVNYQPIPQLTSDNRITSMRNGPKQGYIININAQTQDDTDYASQIISSAVQDSYTNSQINIALNVNETQTSISHNDLYDYFVNSF